MMLLRAATISDYSVDYYLHVVYTFSCDIASFLLTGTSTVEV